MAGLVDPLDIGIELDMGRGRMVAGLLTYLYRRGESREAGGNYYLLSTCIGQALCRVLCRRTSFSLNSDFSIL